MTGIAEREGENFFSVRLKFYVAEINKMSDEKYQFGAILDKLYSNSLSLSTYPSPPSDIVEYLKLSSIFATGLNHYNKAIIEIIQLMELG